MQMALLWIPRNSQHLELALFQLYANAVMVVAPGLQRVKAAVRFEMLHVSAFWLLASERILAPCCTSA